MQRSEALRKLGKILGKQLGYRVDPNAPTREEREAALEAVRPAFAEWKKLDEQVAARKQAILDADIEYQNLKTARKIAADKKDKLRSITMHHKITVGISTSMFFHVKAEGDSWEEVIDRLQQKQTA